MEIATALGGELGRQLEATIDAFRDSGLKRLDFDFGKYSLTLYEVLGKLNNKVMTRLDVKIKE